MPFRKDCPTFAAEFIITHIMKKFFSVFLLSTLISATAFAESKEDQEKKEKGFYTPQVFGVVKAKLEYAPDNSEYRFNVRSSRLGVRGNVAKNLKYSSQIELNLEGKLVVFDAFAVFTPFKFVEFSLGQQLTRFSTEVGSGPGVSNFANRSFLAKFIGNYYWSEEVDGKVKYGFGSLNARDIGLNTTFRYNLGVPATTLIGLMNGSGQNNPVWSKSVNMTFRQEFGTNKGFKIAGSYYVGKFNNMHDISIWDIEMRYAKNNILIESEFAQRKQTSFETQTSNAWVIQGNYRFKLPENKIAKYILPVLRYDLGHNITFKNDETGKYDAKNLSRITFGGNLRLTEKPCQAEIRLQYEHYMGNHKPSDYAINQLFHDKLTLEVVASF